MERGLKDNPRAFPCTHNSPQSEAALLLWLEAVPCMGRLPEPKLNPAAKLTRPTRARSIFNRHKHYSQLQPFASPCVCFHRGKTRSNPSANPTPASDAEPHVLLYRWPLFSRSPRFPNPPSPSSPPRKKREQSTQTSLTPSDTAGSQRPGLVTGY